MSGINSVSKSPGIAAEVRAAAPDSVIVREDPTMEGLDHANAVTSWDSIPLVKGDLVAVPHVFLGEWGMVAELAVGLKVARYNVTNTEPVDDLRDSYWTSRENILERGVFLRRSMEEIKQAYGMVDGILTPTANDRWQESVLSSLVGYHTLHWSLLTNFKRVVGITPTGERLPPQMYKNDILAGDAVGEFEPGEWDICTQEGHWKARKYNRVRMDDLTLSDYTLSKVDVLRRGPRVVYERWAMHEEQEGWGCNFHLGIFNELYTAQGWGQGPQRAACGPGDVRTVLLTKEPHNFVWMSRNLESGPVLPTELSEFGRAEGFRVEAFGKAGVAHQHPENRRGPWMHLGRIQSNCLN
ncbi:hypothetical protein DMENIID0001_041050 [Sergentomyia squamirostris]